MDEQQPGQTISPSSDKNEPEDQTSDKKSSPAKIDKPLPSESRNDADPPTLWRFNTAGDQADGSGGPAMGADSTPNKGAKPFSWSASEYIHHQKSFGWYAALGFGSLVVAAGVYLLTHDKISTGVVIAAAIILGSFANHRPRVLNYRLDDSGLAVGDKFYGYDQFKSFAMTDEGAMTSAILVPLKRFIPPLSLYFEPKDEDKVIAWLSDRLPLEEHKADPLDRFVSRIRF